METEKKSIYGKKVFFVTQNKKFQSAVRKRLLTMEYEVYFIDDYRVVKNLLAESPDSILFISPERPLKQVGWRNFIKTVNQDVYFGETAVGLLLKGYTENMIIEFTSGMKLEAGIIQIKDDDDESGAAFQSIVKVLDKLNAKGMRQYVRANCIGDPKSQVYWLEGSIMHKLNIMDISSVGLALLLPAKNYAKMANLKSIPDAKMSIKDKQVSIPLDVYTIKQAGQNYVIVAMFQMGTNKEVLALIRDYVSDQLLADQYRKILNRPIDKVDYDALIVSNDNDEFEFDS